MSWKNKIPRAFGEADYEFAGHPSESEEAVELLRAASKEDVGLNEYLSRIREWLESEDCSDDHINRQIERVKDISNYFNKD